MKTSGATFFAQLLDQPGLADPGISDDLDDSAS
jgi:hypothetical protein